MDHWYKGKIVELTPIPKEKHRRKDSVLEYNSYWYKGDEKGTHDHGIDIYIGPDGHIFFSEETGDSHLYLYPEQVEHLRTILKELDKHETPKDA